MIGSWWGRNSKIAFVIPYSSSLSVSPKVSLISLSWFYQEAASDVYPDYVIKYEKSAKVIPNISVFKKIDVLWIWDNIISLRRSQTIVPSVVNSTSPERSLV